MSKLNPTQTAALTYIKKHPGTRHKSSETPEAPHHKTIEGLTLRGLVTSKGGGWILTSSGEDAIK